MGFIASACTTCRGHDTKSLEKAHGTTFSQVAKDEAWRCGVMCVGFAVAIIHLYLYPAYFGVKIVDPADVPEMEKVYFHHGWTAMLVIFFIEAITVFLKIWSTRHRKLMLSAVLQKLEGNIGVLFGEYLVVGATYVIMGYNLIPVFEEPRTGRRVYGVRYNEILSKRGPEIA